MLKQMVTGVLLVLRRMVSGHTQTSTGQTQRGQPGASNTSAPTRGGKDKSQDALTQPQPVQSKPKRKLKVAKVATKAPSRKQTQKAVQQGHGQGGSQPATRVKQSSQQKPARKAVQSTIAAKSRKQGQSQPAKQGRGSQAVTPVRKTRQHAK